ncbi:hypothetical protein AJR25_003180 [Shigella flexneri]|nr:hypothetical protein AJR25_003180 [Shigella flexneri]
MIQHFNYIRQRGSGQPARKTMLQLNENKQFAFFQRLAFPLRIFLGNDSNLLIVFYVQIMPDDLVMQLHRF